ncbi:hypothetical protein DPEC_G00173010 [Dallia pectoralis]|uniref:Uncharacterized protein n=1 Tax=Dallia pectoralis TaxID=75939 RepID=A0ACC2GE11_DALPE|nr:hypothetical protein DPEC_G00173010 [Dallia pectoralis]
MRDSRRTRYTLTESGWGPLARSTAPYSTLQNRAECDSIDVTMATIKLTPLFTSGNADARAGRPACHESKRGPGGLPSLASSQRVAVATCRGKVSRNLNRLGPRSVGC